MPLSFRFLRGTLWRNPEFLKFWAGQTISLVGSQFTALALPLTGALYLHANAAQMGLLGASQFAPGLAFGLVAGVWLDRTRRLPVMVGSQAVNMVTLATIPLAALAGVLRMEQLYAVGFVTGTANAFYSVAQNSFLPTLAGRENLVEANSKFQTSRTVAQLLGPGVAGAVVQAITAPLAIAFDALSFLVGALSAAWIRMVEADPKEGGGPRRHVFAEAWEGLAILWRHPLVRSIMLTLVLANFGGNINAAVFVLLFAGRLGVTPAQLGILFAAGSLSSLVGAQVARPLVKRGGVGPVMVAGAVIFSGGLLVTIAAAYAPLGLVFALLLGGNLVVGAGVMVYNVNQQAIRQAVVPNYLLGRANAGMLVLVYGGQVVG